jgi:succinate-acetate transporter protein
MSDEIKQVSLAASTSNPAALGLAGFALTTFVLSMINAGLWSGNGLSVVAALAFFYGGLAQLLAGQQEYKTGNTFGATAFSTYGAFWLSVAFFVFMNLLGLFKGVSPGLGYLLIGFTVFNTYMMIASFKTNTATMLVFVFLEIAFLLLDFGAFGSATANILGGYFGIITALLAWYASAAIVINSTFKKTVLPL